MQLRTRSPWRAVALSTGLAVIAAVVTVGVMNLAPRYLAVCPTDPDRGCTAIGDPVAVPASAVTTSIVALSPDDRTLSLYNQQVTGSATLSVLGWFSAADPSTTESDFGTFAENHDQTVVIKEGGQRTIEVTGLPPAARSLLVRLRPGTPSHPDDSAVPGSGSARTAIVHLTTSIEAVSANDIRSALQALRADDESSSPTSGSPTPSASADPDEVDQIVNEVVDQTGGHGGGSPGPSSSPSPSAPPSPSATPTAAPSPTPPPAPPAPVAGDAAGPGTTGVPAGTALTVVQGDVTVTVAGTVLDSLDIHGIVFVNAPNVTIRNSIIRGTDTGSSGALITATGGFAGLNISDTELAATVPSAYINGIMGSNFTATRVNIHGVIDMVHLTGGNVVLSNSWLHDNLHYAVDPTQGNTPSHDDSVQIQVGTNIQILNNNMSGAHNSGIQITQNRGSVKSVQFSGNTIDGGGCSFNISEGGNGPVTGVNITNNIFGRHTKVPDCAVIAPTTSMPTLSNNHYTDGVSVTVHPG